MTSEPILPVKWVYFPPNTCETDFKMKSAAAERQLKRVDCDQIHYVGKDSDGGWCWAGYNTTNMVLYLGRLAGTFGKERHAATQEA